MNRTGRRLALAGAAAAAAGGVAYGAGRLALERLRRRSDVHAEERFEPAADETHDFDSHDGGTIHVLSRGEGPPLVLSHGLTLSARTWTLQFAALPAEGLRVVAFDHRGHGLSVVGTTGHTIDNLAADFRTVLECLDLHDVVVVGHSMGGIAAQAFAARFPEVVAERVRGLVLVSTIARTPLSAPRAAALLRLARGAAGYVPDSSVVWRNSDLGLLLARVGFGRDARPSDVELVRQMMIACPAETRRDAPQALLGFDLTRELRKITVPTLVIGGTADVITPPFESRRIARLIPDSQLELFEGGGHMLMLEQPDRFNRTLVEFARRVGVNPRGA